MTEGDTRFGLGFTADAGFDLRPAGTPRTLWAVKPGLRQRRIPSTRSACRAGPAGRHRANARRGTKVVSVLFADLVGFTASADRADPEEVLATLRPYHALLRTEIERYGGTVEKFIGDAVMAVFGAPVAHEDDAERAVRAGLRITEALPS